MRCGFTGLKFGALTLLFVSPPGVVWSAEPPDKSDSLTVQADSVLTPTRPADVAKVEPITVQATRPDWESFLSPGTVNVVIPDDYAGEQKKLPEFLEMVPGLHVNRRGGEGQYATLSVRGSTSAQVNIYIDGVPQNTGGDAAVDLSLIPVENVARIEVYRGYVPARFSGAPLGGVVNIVTKKPAGFGGRAAVGASSFNGRRGDLTVTAPLFSGSLLLGVHHEEADGDFKYKYIHPGQTNTYPDVSGSPPFTYDGTVNGKPLPIERRRQSNGYNNTDVLLKWQDEHWQVKGVWKKVDRYYPMITNYGTPNSDGTRWVDTDGLENGWSPMPMNRLSEHRKQELTQYDFTIGRRQRAGKLEWGVEAFYTHQKKDYHIDNLPEWYDLMNVPVAQLWTKYRNERAGVSLDGTYNLGDRHLLEFRVDYSYERQKQDANRFRSKEGGGFTHWFTDGGITFPKYQMLDKYTRTVWHAQLSDTIALGDDDDMWLTVIGRWDQAKDNTDAPDTNTDGIGTWGLALKKEIDPEWTFRASWGSYVRYPNFYELYGDGVYLKAIDLLSKSYARPTRETGYQWDVGLDWRGKLLNGDGRVSFTWFNRRTDNLIGLAMRRLDGTMYYVNRGDMQAWGFEAEGSFTWDRVAFDVSGTWLPRVHHRLLGDPGKGILGYSGSRLYSQPRWEVHGRLSVNPFADKSLSVFAEHHFTGKMAEPYTFMAADDAKRNDLHVTNLGLRYASPWGLNLTAGVNDIMDHRNKQTFHFLNREYGISFPSPGRTWYVSLEYLFGGEEKRELLPPAEPVVLSSSAEVKESSASGKNTKKSPWYLAVKLVNTRQKAKFSSTEWSIGKGHVDNALKRKELIDNAVPNAEKLWNEEGVSEIWADSDERPEGYGPGKDEFIRYRVDLARYLVNHPDYQDGAGAVPYDSGPLPALQAMAHNFSSLSGALALGFDLSQVSNVPVRLELEVGTVFDNTLPNAGFTLLIPPPLPNLPGMDPELPTCMEYSVNTFFANAFLDWHNTSRFTPYIGVGVGAAVIKVDYQTWRPWDGTVETDINFAWHATAGVSFPIARNIDLDLSCRYVNLGYKKRPPSRGIIAKPDFDPNPDNFLYTIQYNSPEIDLRHATQALMSVRFSF